MSDITQEEIKAIQEFCKIAEMFEGVTDPQDIFAPAVCVLYELGQLRNIIGNDFTISVYDDNSVSVQYLGQTIWSEKYADRMNL